LPEGLLSSDVGFLDHLLTKSISGLNPLL